MFSQLAEEPLKVRRAPQDPAMNAVGRVKCDGCGRWELPDDCASIREMDMWGFGTCWRCDRDRRAMEMGLQPFTD